MLIVGGEGVVPGLMAEFEDRGYPAVVCERERLVTALRRHEPRALIVTGVDALDGAEALTRMMVHNRIGLGVPVVVVAADMARAATTLGPTLFEPDRGSVSELADRLINAVREYPPVTVLTLEPKPYRSVATVGPTLRGRQLLIIHPDPNEAEPLAEALRGVGAAVECVAPALALQDARLADPTAILAHPTTLVGGDAPVLERLRHDPRFRWSSVLLMPTDDLLAVASPDVQVGIVAPMLASIGACDDRRSERLRQQSSVTFSIAEVGPIRLLRWVARMPEPRRIEIFDEDQYLELDCSGGVLHGASGERAQHGEFLEARHVLDRWAKLRCGHVRVSRVSSVSLDNVGLPVDAALSVLMSRAVVESTGPVPPRSMDHGAAGSGVTPASYAPGLMPSALGPGRGRRVLLAGAVALCLCALVWLGATLIGSSSP